MKDTFKFHKFSVSATFRDTLEVGNLQDFVGMSNHLDFLSVVSNRVDDFIQMGVPVSKIVSRLEFSGRAHILPEPDRRNMAYYEICDLLSNQTAKWVKYWDAESQMAIAKCKNGSAHGMSVIVFVNGRKVANEVRKMMRLGLAGVMAYALNFDDNLGKCGFDEDTFSDFKHIKNAELHIPKHRQTNFPLLTTIDDAITVAKDEMEQEAKLREFLIFKE